jgi:class 3 adenylate cyclase/ATP/maltotriose-dependent transcriptional regulator MalT
VVLLFSDLCSYTTISEQCDPENVAQLLAMMKTQAVAIVERHGGLVNQFYGDGFLAVFGLPASQEDDVRQAACAALEVHAAVADLILDFSLPAGLEPRLHSGIHAGLIFARNTSLAYGRYELIGDPVNTAARLCASATTNEILVSQETLEGAKEFFEVSSVSPIELKGKKEPVPVYRVLARSPVQTRFEASQRRGFARFVGRRAELIHLNEALVAARRGKGQIVYVVGDPGIGKTRLLHEFEHAVAAPLATVVHGRCERTGRIAPLEPFQQVVRNLFGLTSHTSRLDALAELRDALINLDPTLAEHLPSISHLLVSDEPPAAGPPEGGQPPVNQALLSLLVAAGRQKPLVVMLDDWHWADDASWQVLRELSARVSGEPILVVIGSRRFDLPSLADARKDTLVLAPFSPSEAEVAAQSWLSATMDANAKRALVERAGGNPLFLEELCLARSVEDPRGSSTPESHRVPSTLHGLVESRIERLPAKHADLARIASILGTEFEGRLLQEVSGFEDTLAVLLDLAGFDLIYASETTGSFRFKHGITRDVAYDSVRLNDRQRLHLQVARAIERGHAPDALAEHFETLAYHYAGAEEPAVAAEYAEKAGDKAAATSSLDRVRYQYRAALDALDRLKQTPELRRRWLGLVSKWAAGCVYSPAEDQLVLLRRAKSYATLEEDPTATANAAYWIGWICYALGELEKSIEAFEEARLITTRAQDERMAGQLFANLGQSHAAAGNYAEALRCLDASAEAKRNRAPSGKGTVPVGFAYALGTKGLVLGDTGEFAKAYELLNESLGQLGGRAHAIEGSLLGLLGMVQLWQGDWSASLKTAEAARAVAEVIGEPYVIAIAQSVSGCARYRLTGDLASLAHVREAKDWLEGRKIRLYLSFCASSLADIAMLSGDLDLATENAQFAIERASHGDRLGECLAHRVLAECAGINGDFDRARAELTLARELANRRHSRRDLALTELQEAKLQLLLGEISDARGKLELVSAEFSALDMPWYATHASGLLPSAPR